MGTDIFWFHQKLFPWRVSKEGTPHSVPIFSNAHNLGLEWTFWTISGLKTIVWSLAIWWAQKFLNFGPICACGSCLKRAPVKAFWLILPNLFLNPHNFGLEWTFWIFSVLKRIVLSLHWLCDGHRSILMLALFVPVAAVQTWQQSRHFGQFRQTYFQTPITLV